MNLETIKKQLESFVEQKGYELCSLTLGKEKGSSVISLVIDREQAIDLNAISLISEQISKFLDEEALIEEKYTLDICSLGIEKPIPVEKLPLYVGKYVNVQLNNPHKGLNIIEGLLENSEGDILTISYKEKTRTIKIDLNVNNILKARLAFKF